MKILGLNSGEINSSAMLLVDGQVVCGAPEERFTREKFTKAFPANAIRYCLDYSGAQLSDLDAIAQAWNPGATWQTFNPHYSGTRTARENNFYALTDNLFNLAARTPGDYVEMRLPADAGMPPTYHVQHHRCHAANAFFLSGFDEAAVLTCDFRGELECTTWSMARDRTLIPLSEQQLPNSLGMFYATYTQLLGYRPDSDEWKVMAMSAYPGDCSRHLNKIRSTYKLHDDGMLELDLKYYVGTFSHYPNLYSSELMELLGPRGAVNKDEPSDWDMSVAKAMQLCSEEIASHFLQHLYERTKCKNVALGGGFFMNSVFNGKVLESAPYDKVYLSYAPSDAGNSIGAALYVNHLVHDGPRVPAANSSLIGPDYDNEVIQSALHRRRIPFTKIDDIPSTTARLCADGYVVAFFNGRMEFGDRALGGRSILADPRREEMKDKINAQVKYREAYRPFAPATVAECVHVYFDVPEGFEARYMEQVVKVRSECAAELPAVTHFDRSARVQTVKRDESAVFHAVLKAFEELTSFPILVNTSFNVNGEPIVLTPDDAITTFFNSGLEYLVIGNCLVSKACVGSAAQS